MKGIIKKMDWFFDYYIAYFLYNPHKIDKYHAYMLNKWEPQGIDFVKSTNQNPDEYERMVVNTLSEITFPMEMNQESTQIEIA